MKNISELQNKPKIENLPQFYKDLFILVWPIALQNLISATVNSADVMMLGYINQTALAAASLAGQIHFILTLFFTGVSSGITMLTAQYWGKKDTNSIEILLGIGLKISFPLTLIFSIFSCFFPQLLMGIFTNDPILIETGSTYLRIVGISFLFMSISQVYQAVLRSIEKVKTVTGIVFTALALNVFLNAVFIFGLLGAPKMGIKGVALATAFARFIELCLTIFFALKTKVTTKIHFSPLVVFKNNTVLLKDFFKFSMPALGNEFVWGAAFAMYSVILGRMGEDIVAANSVVTVTRNLASVLCFGMAYGGAIILGKELGTGNYANAEKNASRLCWSTIAAGVLGGFIIFFVDHLFLRW